MEDENQVFQFPPIYLKVLRWLGYLMFFMILPMLYSANESYNSGNDIDVRMALMFIAIHTINGIVALSTCIMFTPTKK